MSRSRAEFVQVEIEPGWWLSSGRALFLEAGKDARCRRHPLGDYADSHRRAGNLLPLWGNAETAQRLRRLLDFYQPARMIWLGDSLHTSGSAEAAEEFLAAHAPPEMVVLRGNHDRKWARITADEYRLGPLLLSSWRSRDRGRAWGSLRGSSATFIRPSALGDGAGTRVKAPVAGPWPPPIDPCRASPTGPSGASWNGELAADEKLWVISSRRIWPLSGARLG